MTSQRERVELHDRLNEVLGSDPAATLWNMLPVQDDLATKSDIASVRDELKGEIADVRTELADVRTEIAFMRQELDLKYATKADLLDLKRGFDDSFHAYLRTFMATQAATVVGVTGIVYALVRLT